MKEQLEKLISLLNEYESQEWFEYEDEDILKSEIRKIKDRTITYNWISTVQISNTFLVPIIISKQYGFIKWLLDNNLLDVPKDYDWILMSLAIDDYPLKALLTILK